MFFDQSCPTEWVMLDGSFWVPLHLGSTHAKRASVASVGRLSRLGRTSLTVQTCKVLFAELQVRGLPANFCVCEDASTGLPRIRSDLFGSFDAVNTFVVSEKCILSA